MAQGRTVDEYGNEIDPMDSLQQRAQQSSGGYSGQVSSPQEPAKTPSFTPQQRDTVVQGWLKSDFGATTQGIRDYLGSLGDAGAGWRMERDDKVYDPEGRVYDWIGDVNTDRARKRSGYTTDTRYANVTGATAGKAAKAPAAAAPAAARSAGATASTSLTSAQQQDAALRAQLVSQLQQRAQQGLNIDPNTDPVIRAQADAFAAQQERARRNYISDVAESQGPLANIRGEERMAAERMGSATGAFEADLVGRELTARRAEISDALNSLQGLLTTQQEMNLRKELALMDDAINRMKLQQDQAQFNADLGYRNRALSEQGRQFNNQLGFNYDQFDWDRSPLNPRNFPTL